MKHESKLIAAIPFSEAVLCLDCDFLTPREAAGKCGLCGSAAILDVKATMERSRDEVKMLELNHLLDSAMDGTLAKQ